MHEDVFAGLRGDESKALLGVEPLHGSNSHVLVPPSIVSEVSTNADATLAPTARDKLDLRVAKQNVNLCRAHGSGCGHCPLPNPGLRDAAQRALAALEPSSCAAAAAGLLPGAYLEGGGVTVGATASAATGGSRCR